MFVGAEKQKQFYVTCARPFVALAFVILFICVSLCYAYVDPFSQNVTAFLRSRILRIAVFFFMQDTKALCKHYASSLSAYTVGTCLENQGSEMQRCFDNFKLLAVVFKVYGNCFGNPALGFCVHRNRPAKSPKQQKNHFECEQ